MKKNKTKLSEWQIKAKLGGECSICKKTVKKLTVDHIIPVTIVRNIDLTGEAIYEDEENFELICSPCNSLKSHNLDRKNPKTKKILEKYLKD